jgi:NarL family two-component system response regulator LiaR
MTQSPIRVLIVDDFAVVRSGLSDFLQAHDDIAIVGEAGCGHAAITTCLKLKPDVVLMDMMMPDMDGATATGVIRLGCPSTQVIILCSFVDEIMVSAAVKAGAIGYLLKSISPHQLVDAIRAAAVGRPTLAPEATLALIHTATAPNPPGYDLTRREREVLQLMICGLNNPQIAQRLTVSLSTVKYHVSNVISKLGVANRTEAATFATQHHLVN